MPTRKRKHTLPATPELSQASGKSQQDRLQSAAQPTPSPTSTTGHGTLNTAQADTTGSKLVAHAQTKKSLKVNGKYLVEALTGFRVSLSVARPRSTIPKTPIYPTYVGIGTRVERRRATTTTTSSTMTMCHPAQNHGQGCHH